MKNKGFTLVELMGALIILGILSIIIIPIVDKNIKSGQEEMYINQIRTLKLGLESWASDNMAHLPTDGEKITLTLYQLKQSGSIEMNVTNPKTKKLFPNDMLFTIENTSGRLTYNVLEDTGTPSKDKADDKYMPSITLNGTILEYVELGSTYSDKGVIAKTSSGTDISDVSIEVSGDGSSVNTTDDGSKYTVTYIVTDNGYTAKIIRTVIIRSTNAPILTIPDNIVIYTDEVESFDIMAGVSATDVLGKPLSVTSKGIVGDIPSVYTITYSATDSNGNTASRKRNITVKADAEKQLAKTAVTSGDGLYSDNGIYRYKGSNPNNYINLNGTNFRIISVSSEGIKLILGASTGTRAWDSGNINDWDKMPANSNIASDMLTYLNTTYYQTLLTTLGSTSSLLKNNGGFQIGKITASSRTIEVADTEAQINIWRGYVGLISYTDFIKSQLPSSASSCLSNSYSNSACATNNWLVLGANEWTITPSASSTAQCYYIHSSGYTAVANCATAYATRPVFVISKEITLTGTGTSANPYTLK